jgi:GNAT superfamily N-acetyltransferase
MVVPPKVRTPNKYLDQSFSLLRFSFVPCELSKHSTLDTMANKARPRTSSTPTSHDDEDDDDDDSMDKGGPNPTGSSSLPTSISQAAQCMQLCLLLDTHHPARGVDASDSPKALKSNDNDNNTFFAPVFTHQCFPDDTIRGYQPANGTDDDIGHDIPSNVNATRKTAKTATNTNDRHRHRPLPASTSNATSAAANATTCKDIQITVHLAPSGRSCRVDIDISNPKKRKRKRDRKDSLSSLQSLQLPPTGVGNKKQSFRTSPRKSASENEQSLRTSPRKSASENDNHSVNGEERKSTSDYSSEDEEYKEDEEESTEEEEEEEEEEEDGADDSSYTLNSSDDGDDSVDPEEDYEDYANDNDNENSHSHSHGEVTEGVTRKRRMPVAEIRERLKTALPTITDDSISTLKQDYLRRPIGTVLKEYAVDDDDQNKSTFCLSLATGQKAAPYHEQVQRLALLFIETADEVDVADETAGYWKVLYLFRKHSATKYSLAGYLTLYHFAAPFRKPLPGTVARICQVLLLPPYQRSGHGQVMLQAVADLAHGVYTTAIRQRPVSPSKKELTSYAESLVEVNVEDPAPGFTALRNRVDYVRFRQHHSYSENDDDNNDDDDDNNGGPEPWIDRLRISATSNTPNVLTPLTDVQITQAATRAKITTRQIQIVYELYQLDCLQRYTVAFAAAKAKAYQFRRKGAAVQSDEPAVPSANAIETLEKRYRLAVKKRLNKAHREELSACRNKEEMKVALGVLYDETLQAYQAILASVQRQRERSRK